MAVVLAVVACAASTLVLPEGFTSVRGLNPRAAADWRAWWGTGATGWLGGIQAALSLPAARLLFRASTVVAWGAYAGLVWSVFRGARLGQGWTWPLAVPLVLVLAVAMPAVLSTDVFAYLGYGRMAAVHGLNPHLHTQTELVRLGDPTAPYLRWPIASPYGPLWTMLSIVVVRAAPVGAVLAPVIAFKLVAGAALLGTAAAARFLFGRAVPGPASARSAAVFALVALNPLLLLEGPGSGHNDVVMMAVLLGALVTHAAGRPRVAAGLVGVAAAVKLVPLLLVPWLALLAWRAAGGPRWPRLAAAVVTVLVALAPVAMAYAPFWEGPRTLGGLGARWDAAAPAMSTPTPSLAPSAGSPSAPPSPISTSRLLAMLGQAWPALLVFLWATAAVALGQGEPVLRLATVWGVVSLAVMLFVAGMWFPWYLAWTWPVVVLRFTRVHVVLAGFLLPLSLMLMLAYAWPPA